MFKNYIGISRDHSLSMQGLTKAAARDYNSLIEDLKTGSAEQEIDTIISVVQNGVGRPGKVVREIVNSSLSVALPINEHSYVASGTSTPLFDSIGELIDIFENTPDANDPEVAFMIFATTDGEDNDSPKWRHKLAAKIKELQSTDRWTFVFRIPKGHYKRQLMNLGIPEGNIYEWETTLRGIEISTVATTSAVKQYYNNLKSGTRATTKFYADLSMVSEAEIKTNLTDISGEVIIWDVLNNAEIAPFSQARLNGRPPVKGCAFYQLLKTEPRVQDYKKIVIRDKNTNHVYGGRAARQLLGLTFTGTVRLHPGDFSHYDVFIQSTSVNRKLPAGSQLLYWANATVDK